MTGLFAISGSSMAYEFDKARSMIRNYVILGLAAAFSMGFLILITTYQRNQVLGDQPTTLSEFDAVGLANSQLVNFGSTLLALLGIMLVSYDFQGSVLQGSALAIPNRLETYTSKLAVTGLISGAFAIIMVPASFILTQSMLGETHAVGLGDEGVFRSLCGAIVYLIAMTVFAVGLTTALRSSALAIGILMPLMFILSSILRAMPIDVISTIAQLLPDQAGARMATASTREDALFGPMVGALVLFAWVGLAVVAGAIVHQKRDVGAA